MLLLWPPFLSHSLPEAGDLLRREGPGLLDPEYLAEEREYDDFKTRHSRKEAKCIKQIWC